MRCLANFNKFLFQKISNELINDLKKLFIFKIRLDVRQRKVDVTSQTRNGVTNMKLEAETLCRIIVAVRKMSFLCTESVKKKLRYWLCSAVTIVPVKPV